MSDENKDLGDKAGEAFEKAKETAKETAQDAKEAASDFADEAKKTANEFTEGLKSAGGDNKKILAGILAIILGSLGVHKFILGYNKEGFILLGITLVSYVLMCFVIGAFLVWIPGLIGLIEGIIYLTKSDEEFYNTYQVGKKPWF
ncbi:MAG: NINE protein [Bacteroidota bacterium]